MTESQKQFVHRSTKHQYLIIFYQLLVFIMFIFLWELSAKLKLLDSFIFSSPSRVITAFIKMCNNGEIFYHIGITLLETLISFSLVTILGIGTAILLWLIKILSDILEPYLVILNSLPKSALAPLLIVWLGNNMKTIIVTAISVAIFGTIVSIYTCFNEVDSEKIKLIQTLGGNRRNILFKLILPSSLPMIISIMKVNIGLCLVGVIIGEFLAARAGLGYLIIYSSQTFKLNWVIMSITILCIIAMGLYQLINCIEKIYKKKIAAN